MDRIITVEGTRYLSIEECRRLGDERREKRREFDAQVQEVLMRLPEYEAAELNRKHKVKLQREASAQSAAETRMDKLDEALQSKGLPTVAALEVMYGEGIVNDESYLEMFIKPRKTQAFGVPEAVARVRAMVCGCLLSVLSCALVPSWRSLS